MNYTKPVLLLGQGARGSRYLEYAEKYQFPILTSRLGIDLIEYNHSLFIGHPGNYGDVAARLVIEQSDLIFVAGCRLSSALVGYEPKKWGKKADILVVDIDEQELIKPGIKITNPVHSTCEAFFDKLLKVDTTPQKNTKWVKQCQKWKRKYQIPTKEMLKQKNNSYVWTKKLSDLASPNDIILVDTGSCFHVVAQAWKIKKGQKFITTGGLSSMGWWCASLGAGVLGHTLCITGDGSFMMNVQELATIKHNNLPIKIFIWNNGGYGLIKATQKRFMKGRHIGVDEKTGLWFPDFKKIADAFEIPYYTDHPKDIKSVFAEPGPAICEVKIPCDQTLLRPADLSIAQSV